MAEAVVGRLRLRVGSWRSLLRLGPASAVWALLVAILILPIAMFLVIAISPRLLGQGDQWFTLQAFARVLSPSLLPAAVNSVSVALAAGVGAVVVGAAMAWLEQRTDLPGRRLWSGMMFALMLAPSYLIALGWERLLEPAGVLDVLGLHAAWLRGHFYGPLGVSVVLGVKGLPFAYLAIAGALRGLGDEFEDAARVHGGGPVTGLRISASLLAPAFWSAFAIVFAESVSDFGVADTLAHDAHFPVLTYTLFTAIDAFPVDFPVAAAIGWVLLGLAGLAILAQNLAMRGRAYQVLGGRTRQVRRRHLGVVPRLSALAGATVVGIVGVGIPLLGALAASLFVGMGTLAASPTLTLDNYRRVLESAALHAPLAYSAEMAFVTAFLAVGLGLVCARALSSTGNRLSGRILDLMLLTAVALPGIVFAAGYIFAYNLPIMNRLGIHIYGTSLLLLLGYVATALPSTARVLVGSVSQLQSSMGQAARVHGADAIRAWLSSSLPLLARPILNAWLLTFSATLLELPVSQLLYPPGNPPVSVGITKALSAYDLGGGTAMEVVSIALVLVVMGATWLGWRLLAPRGWKRIGEAR